MAELLATMAIRPLVSMLMSKVSGSLLEQYKVMEGMEAQHKILKRRLPIILDVIIDVEKQAMVQREGVKAWLQELKAVACEANEVFDEFKYEALRREAKKNGHYTKLGFDVIKLFPTHNHVVFRHRMGRKLCRILQAIELLIAEMHAFMFSYQPQLPVSKQCGQVDIIDTEEIASRSRHKEKMDIVDVLLGQASNADLAIVPIVGMGGLGKTTLARLIYNEPEIQKHFQLLLWVCVSDIFDVNSLAKSIVEASPNKSDDTDKPPLGRLKKLVSGQRYLLVLDDVWNREVHKWERLKVCLQHGGTGSAVLTTTRDEGVAEIMGADRAYCLNVLGDSFIKEIVETRAFSSDNSKPPKLLKMVGEIVKKCSGSPLAATALGSILRTKTIVQEWKAVLSGSNICTEETGILPLLKLSYNDFPSYMKMCFVFCAIFPKDYKIDVDKLIQLWIANGYIPEHKEDSLETIGKHIFNELASRSFFLDIEESKTYCEYYSRTTCKIHDLMHDIAVSVMERQSIIAIDEPSQIGCLPDDVQHLFLSHEETEGVFLSREEAKGISNEFVEKRSPVIRTVICDSSMGSSLQHLSKYNSLHALKVHIERKSFPLKPMYLRYLRYLDLSGSFIKALPEDISILYNLQMLDLSNCVFLDRLPRLIMYMTSLRHLYTHGCPELKSMPPEFRKLTKLQTLTCFVAAVTGPDCSDVAELQHLNLGGQLELCQVENVKEAEAKVANIGNKKGLRELTLRWTSVCDSEALNSFEPHYGLEVLRIYSYGGKCVGLLQSMVEIHLFHCERLHCLFSCRTSFTFPNLRQLTLEHLLDFERWFEITEMQEQDVIFPLLEKLFIRHCGKLVALPEAQQFDGPCGRHRSLVFPALKILELKDLERFQRWDAAEGTRGEQILFPCLEKLSIQECPKLVALPEAPLLQEASSGDYRLVHSIFPALKVLEMNGLDSFQRWNAIEETRAEQILFPWLEKLSIKKCPKLTDLPQAPKLSVLEIEDGKQEIFCCVHRYSCSLTNLILKLEDTETTSEAEYTLTEPVDKSPLIVMELRYCNSFFGAGALELWDYFVHLKELEIDRCDVLVHWPEKVFQSLVSLIRLVIKNCENLTGYAEARLEPSASQRSQHLPALESLVIYECASLVEMFNVPASLERINIEWCPKLESILGKQQGMSELVQGSPCSEAIMCAAVSELPSSHMNHFCRCLEDLSLSGCGSLPAVLNLPPSLKSIFISRCTSIQVLLCQLDGLHKPQVTTTSINVSEPAAAAREHSLPPCLESLTIGSGCDGMLGGILRLPTSLKTLSIDSNSGLTSLESLLADHTPSLESLCLEKCSALASLPNEPQAYGSLTWLVIKGCPAIKKLPRCLQQQLCSMDGANKELDAQYEVTVFKPKTWKKITRLVRERREAARESRERQQSMQE